MKTYTQHPLSAAYPGMSDDEYQALKQSVDMIGVQNPITLFEGQVIDGWHRYCAASELGLKCPTKQLGDVDPVDFVRSQNDARRNLTPSQRTLAISTLYEWRKVGKPNVAPGATLAKTNRELADIAGVSERTIRQAKVVAEKASAEVKDAVKVGKMSIKQAAQITQPPKPAPKEYGPGGDADKPATEPAEEAPSEDELQANAMAAQADADYLQSLLDADDKLAAIHAENKRLHAEVAQLKVARDGYMRELTEYKKITAKVQRENDRLRKNK